MQQSGAGLFSTTSCNSLVVMNSRMNLREQGTRDKQGNKGTREQGDKGTWGQGNKRTRGQARGQGNKGTRGQGNKGTRRYLKRKTEYHLLKDIGIKLVHNITGFHQEEHPNCCEVFHQPVRCIQQPHDNTTCLQRVNSTLAPPIGTNILYHWHQHTLKYRFCTSD